MEIIQIRDTDSSRYLDQISEIHLLAYSGGHFTSKFGSRKLAEYNQRLIENSDLTLVALEGGKVVGYVIAGEHVDRGVTRFIADNRMFLVQRLLAHPRFLADKIAWKLSSLLRREQQSEARYRLLSIATRPSDQSRGIGAQLIESLEAELRRRGVKIYGLSVLSKNLRAVQFYERHGFLLEKEVNGSTSFVRHL